MTYTSEQQKANRDKWVAALRSGEFKQGREVLRNVEADKYCCLGVACALAIREGVESEWPDDGGYSWDEELPYAVRDWLGLKTGAGDLAEGDRYNHLIALNDDARYTFTQIADVIDRGGVKLADPS